MQEITHGERKGDMTDANDEAVIRAMTAYLEESLSQEKLLRELLAKAGYNDPDASVEECVARLVQDHLRLRVPC